MATLVQLMKQINSLNEILQSAERNSQFMQDFARDNRLLAEFFTKNISQELAKRGWFIAGSLYPPQYQPLSDALKNQAEDQVEEFLKTHVRGMVSNVRKNAVERWRDRAEILDDAFDAHVQRKFTLSIPVLLAQADGISAHLLGAYLFHTDREHGSITSAASSAINNHCLDRPLYRSFLGLLLQSSGLRIQTQRRDELVASGGVYSPLNRHGVLHGLDCDYATEANSLRGVALISFLEWVAQVIPEKDGSPTNKDRS